MNIAVKSKAFIAKSCVYPMAKSSPASKFAPTRPRIAIVSAQKIKRDTVASVSFQEMITAVRRAAVRTPAELINITVVVR